jgi:hypothetical protein
VRGGNTSGSLRGGRPPEKSNFYCHPGRAGGSPRLLANVVQGGDSFDFRHLPDVYGAILNSKIQTITGELHFLSSGQKLTFGYDVVMPSTGGTLPTTLPNIILVSDDSKDPSHPKSGCTRKTCDQEVTEVCDSKNNCKTKTKNTCHYEC